MPESDGAVLEQIAKAEQKIFATCDLIPTTHWGFDEETQERLRQRKHKLVDEQLSKKEKKRLNNAQKGSMARSLGVSGTISEVFQWLSVSNVRPNVQVKTPAVKLEKPAKVNEKTEKVQQPQKTEKKQESSSEEDEGEEAPKTATPVEKTKPAGKPVATVKPTVRVEKEVESGEDDDSTDEESAPVGKKGGQKRKNPIEIPTSAKKTKLDKELEKFESVDPSSLDPIESRHMAMLKLQKRLETMKQSRTGKKQDGAVSKKAAEALAEKKLKRRMSKLQMKQRRAEEKKKANGEDSTPKAVKKEKTEEPIVNDEGKVVYSKFDFIVKDPKKKRLSTSEKKEKFTGKDYRSLLHKAEKRNEKLAELKEADPEKGQQMEEDIKWNRALKKAEGVKVKDNVDLLKKGLRKKEKAKEKRLAKWDQRVEKVSSDKAKKQDKRTTNIAKRADDKKKKKMTKLRKKGRIL